MKPLSSNCYRFVAAVFALRGGLVGRLLALAPALAVPLLLLASAPASAQCPGCIPVTTCATLSTHGASYELMNDLTSVSSGDCLRIISSGVFLDGEGHNITGPGTAGIHITRNGAGAVIENVGIVSGFGIGLLDEGSEATVDVLEADGNGLAGVKLSGVIDSVFTHITADTNLFNGACNIGGYGVWLANSSDNVVAESSFSSNDVYGVFVESPLPNSPPVSAGLPPCPSPSSLNSSCTGFGTPASCCTGAGKGTCVGLPSNDNLLVGLTANDNGPGAGIYFGSDFEGTAFGFDVADCPGLIGPNLCPPSAKPSSNNQVLQSIADTNTGFGGVDDGQGIVIDNGESANVVSLDSASGNATDDAADFNLPSLPLAPAVLPCDHNRWLLNTFGTNNQTASGCID